MTENVNIAREQLSWLGFGYTPQFSKSTHFLYRAGYKSNKGHQMWNEDFVVDKVDSNRFLDRRKSTDAYELGMLSDTNTII